MSYQSSPFGGVGNEEKDQAGGSAASTNAHYGLRDTQDGIVSGGKLESSGSIQEAVVYFKASDFTVESATVAAFDTQLSLPAGSIVVDGLFEVTETFTTSGTISTSTKIHVGESGSEVANGVEASGQATEFAAATSLDAVGNGEWGDGTALAAQDVSVNFVAGGGTITSFTGGAGKVVVRYRKV